MTKICYHLLDIRKVALFTKIADFKTFQLTKTMGLMEPHRPALR